MKRIPVILISLLAVTAACLGADLKQSQMEVYTGIEYGFQNEGQHFPPILVGVGYYIADKWSLGLYTSGTKTGWDSYWGVSDAVVGAGLFTEYNFSWGSAFVPYAALRLGLLDGNKTDDTVFHGAVGLGLKIFVFENWALATELNLNYSDEEIYGFDRDKEAGVEVHDVGAGDGDRFAVRGNVTLRYFF